MSFILLEDFTDQEIIDFYHAGRFDGRHILTEVYLAGREELVTYFMNEYRFINRQVNAQTTPLPLLQRIAVELQELIVYEDLGYVCAPVMYGELSEYLIYQLIALFYRAEEFKLKKDDVMDEIMLRMRNIQRDDIYEYIEMFVNYSTTADDLETFITGLEDIAPLPVIRNYDMMLYLRHRSDLIPVMRMYFPIINSMESANRIRDAEFPLSMSYMHLVDIETINIKSLKLVDQLLKVEWGVYYQEPEIRLREIQRKLRNTQSFVMSLLLSDEYYKLKEDKKEEAGSRFLAIMAKLPTTFQLKILEVESYSAETINSELKKPFYWLD